MSSRAAQIRVSLLGAAKAVVEGEKVQKAIRGIREETDDLERAGTRMGAVRDGITALIAPVAKLSIIGMLPAAAGAAAAGFTAVGASLGPVVGAAAPAAAGMLAVQTSMGLAKASALGLDKSFDGVFDRFQHATPATEQLASTVKKFVPDLVSLQRAAQRRILGGLSDGLKSASPLLAAVRPQLLATSDVMGGLARRAGTLAGSPFFTGASARILKTNAGVIDDVGGAGLHLTSALVRVLDTARPHTAWFGRLTARAGAFIDRAAAAGQKSGKLAAFFDKTRVVLSRLGRIIADVAVGMFNIFRQGAPLGDSLMVSIVRGAQAFRDWTASARGQNAIGQWFATARPVIDQTAGLIGDLAQAWARIGAITAPTVAPMLAQLRTLVPVIEQVVTATTMAFGPAVVDLIVALASALQPIAGSSGPLLMLVQGLTLLARGFTWVVQNVPGASAVISTLAGTIAVLRALTLGSMVATRLWSAVTAAAGVAAGIYRTAVLMPLILAVARYRLALLASSIATRAAAIAQGALNLVMTMNPIGLVIAALVAVAAAFVVAYRKIGWFRNAVQAVWGWLKDNWPLVLSILTGPIGAAVIYIVRHWDQVKTAASSVVGWVKDRFNGIVGFFAALPGRIGKAVSGMWNGLKSGLVSALNWVIDKINWVIGKIPNVLGSRPDKIKPISTGGGPPAQATGGVMTRPGMTWVGERGPELVSLPRGATTYPAGPSAAFGAARGLRAADYRPIAGRPMPEGRQLTVAGEDGSGLVIEATFHVHTHIGGREVNEEVNKQRVRVGERD